MKLKGKILKNFDEKVEKLTQHEVKGDPKLHGMKVFLCRMKDAGLENTDDYRLVEERIKAYEKLNRSTNP